MGVWSYDFVEAQTHDGRKLRLMTLIDEFTALPLLERRQISRSHATSARQCGLGIPNLPAAMRRIWQVALQARPRSVDRTRSPIGVSEKREYFKYQPETIVDFAPKLLKLGV